jgi:hypothetical protein
MPPASRPVVPNYPVATRFRPYQQTAGPNAALRLTLIHSARMPR